MSSDYFVYILASTSRALYVGVTNDLLRRVFEHKHKLIPGHTQKYNITRLVHFETTPNVNAAIAREKQIKGWTRVKKLALIETANAAWTDLSEEWAEDRTS
jgi:putative endonuclease